MRGGPIGPRFAASCTRDAARARCSRTRCGPLSGARTSGRTSASRQPRRGRSWSRGTSSVSSDVTSTGRAPSSASRSNTCSRSAWHISTMTRAASCRVPPSGPPRAAVQLGPQRGRLRVVDRHGRRIAAAGDDAGQQLADDRLRRPAAQVPQGLLDGDPLRPFRGDPADAPERVVRPVAGGPDDHRDRGRPTGSAPGDPLGDVEHRRDAGLVVGEVDDDHLRPQAEQVQPARRLGGIGPEVEQAVADLVDRRAETASAAGRRQRVRDVVAGQPADRDRDAPDLGDVGHVRAVRLDQPAAADQVRPTAALHVAPDGRRPTVGEEREERDVRPDPPGDRRRRTGRRR